MDPPAEKPAGYYAEGRDDLVARLPRPVGRVLDVGCGEGGAGRALRAAGAASITGIEAVAEVAERAGLVYDRVEVGDALEVAAALADDFDTVLCYDVLEHLVDPYSLLSMLRERTVEGGHLHISVPNARFYRLAWDLIVRGTFDYAAYGHRDSTHLRWFTRRDLEASCTARGWSVVESRPTAELRRTGWLDAPTGGVVGELLSPQWQLLARASS